VELNLLMDHFTTFQPIFTCTGNMSSLIIMTFLLSLCLIGGLWAVQKNANSFALQLLRTKRPAVSISLDSMMSLVDAFMNCKDTKLVLFYHDYYLLTHMKMGGKVAMLSI